MVWCPLLRCRWRSWLRLGKFMRYCAIRRHFRAQKSQVRQVWLTLFWPLTNLLPLPLPVYSCGIRSTPSRFSVPLRLRLKKAFFHRVVRPPFVTDAIIAGSVSSTGVRYDDDGRRMPWWLRESRTQSCSFGQEKSKSFTHRWAINQSGFCQINFSKSSVAQCLAKKGCARMQTITDKNRRQKRSQQMVYLSSGEEGSNQEQFRSEWFYSNSRLFCRAMCGAKERGNFSIRRWTWQCATCGDKEIGNFSIRRWTWQCAMCGTKKLEILASGAEHGNVQCVGTKKVEISVCGAEHGNVQCVGPKKLEILASGAEHGNVQCVGTKKVEISVCGAEHGNVQCVGPKKLEILASGAEHGNVQRVGPKKVESIASGAEHGSWTYTFAIVRGSSLPWAVYFPSRLIARIKCRARKKTFSFLETVIFFDMFFMVGCVIVRMQNYKWHARHGTCYRFSGCSRAVDVPYYHG